MPNVPPGTSGNPDVGNVTRVYTTSGKAYFVLNKGSTYEIIHNIDINFQVACAAYVKGSSVSVDTLVDPAGSNNQIRINGDLQALNIGTN